MSIRTAMVAVSEVTCDTCQRTKVGVMGHGRVARNTLNQTHGWKCDVKLKTDHCPICKVPDLVDKAASGK